MTMIRMTEEGLAIIEEFKRIMIRLDQLEFIREDIYSFYYANYISELEAGETTKEFEIDEDAPEHKGIESIERFLICRRIEAMMDMRDYGFETKEPIKLYRGAKESKSEPDNEDLIMSGFIFLFEGRVIMFVCEDEGHVYFNEYIDSDMEFTFLQDLSKDKQEESVFEA